MKITIVYREESDHAREVFDFLRDFEKEQGKSLKRLIQIHQGMSFLFERMILLNIRQF